MNAISPALALIADAPAFTPTALGQRLAEVDAALTAIDDAPQSAHVSDQARAAWNRKVLERERFLLEELMLIADPATLTDAAAMAMVLSDEVRCLGLEAGPNREWKDVEDRAEVLARAVQRVAWCITQAAEIDPASLGGLYYMSLLMRKHGLRPECEA